MRDLVADWRKWSPAERVSAASLALGIAALVPVLLLVISTV
jgi:hypothetical protein